MFIAYKDTLNTKLIVYIPISTIESVEYSYSDEYLCLRLKECPTWLKEGRSEKECSDFLAIDVPVEQHDFVLAQLHRLGGFTKDEIARLQEYPNA
jgi:hypothetical protein